MVSKGSKTSKLLSDQALLAENRALKDEVWRLRAQLEEAEELKRAISEGDLDALVIPRPEGELIFTLDSADHAYRTLVETMNEGTATLACDGTILYCNHYLTELLRIPPQSIIGNSFYRFIDPESIITFKALQDQEKGNGEIILRAEGDISLPAYLSISSFQAEGSPGAWCLVVTDLTEQKKNEEVLANIEAVRKKEIHHRIKNNLQVISSLLDLEAEKFNSRESIKDSEVLEAFRESQNRVISIALIHEELHEGGEIDKLKFPVYLEKLVKNLFKTYNLGNNEISLTMDLQENIFLNMDTAVPLGIIVNELVSNSLKHAFSGRDKGVIQIKLFSEEAGNEPDDKEELTGKSSRYSLIISDDGVGIPEKIDLEDLDTLGLQLVHILVDQLDGEIKIKNDKGTKLDITINV